MGHIPAQDKMTSSIITNPQPGEDLEAGKDFDVKVAIANLQAGSFTNPANTYYAAPQALSDGIVIGHTHITIQDLGGSITPSKPPEADKFVFFKGVNNTGNGQGLLQATVKGGLPAGNYRVCTMTSASNHQPVLMPVAQRGAQDDCTKFTVGRGTGRGSGDGGSGGEAAESGSSVSSAAATGSSAARRGDNEGEQNDTTVTTTSTNADGVIRTSATTSSSASATSTGRSRSRGARLRTRGVVSSDGQPRSYS